MSLIDIANLTFGYDGTDENIFENVSFRIDTDWKLGFTGRNGRGKTTFLNLLLGKYEYSGTISSHTEFEYFPYAPSDEHEITAEIIREHAPGAEDWEILRELSLLECGDDVMYRPFCTLSNGEQTKALLAALFLDANRFLLIDEPTNHLDVKGREAVGRYLNAKKGFLLVSHDRKFLDSCIDHILSINKTDIQIQPGNFSSWMSGKQMQDRHEQNKNEKLKKDIKRLTQSAQRTEKWSLETEKGKYGSKNAGLRPDRGYVGHKAAKLMARSKSIETRQLNAAAEKEKLLKNIENSEALKITPISFYTQNLVEVEGLSIFYGEKAVCENVSFTVHSGEKILLSGKNGSGKSSILKLICGEDIPHTGAVRKSERLKISYVPQTADGLSGTLRDYAEHWKIDETRFKTILRKFDFSRTLLEKPAETFSQGQKKKVLLARSLCENAHIYIWDEPLNYIDVISRMQIEELLAGNCTTLLFVEHDLSFCEKIAGRIISL